MKERGVTFAVRDPLWFCHLCGEHGLIGWATDHHLNAHPIGDPSRAFDHLPWPHPDSLTGVTIEGAKPTP